MAFSRRSALTALALPTLALVFTGLSPLSAGAVLKHPTTSSVLLAAKAALGKETSVHVKVSSVSTKGPNSVVADIGKTSGRETYVAGDETFTIEVTPAYAYLSGSKQGLINLMDLTVKEQKKVGTRAIAMKVGTSPYANFKSNLTSGSFANLLPLAKGTTLLTKRDAATGGYQLKWKDAATSSSAASTSVLTISAGKEALPIKETVTTVDGTSQTRFSQWGERVTVTVPKSTVPFASVIPKS
jgi:hypothetical protein